MDTGAAPAAQSGDPGSPRQSGPRSIDSLARRRKKGAVIRLFPRVRSKARRWRKLSAISRAGACYRRAVQMGRSGNIPGHPRRIRQPETRFFPPPPGPGSSLFSGRVTGGPPPTRGYSLRPWRETRMPAARTVPHPASPRHGITVHPFTRSPVYPFTHPRTLPPRHRPNPFLARRLRRLNPAPRCGKFSGWPKRT